MKSKETLILAIALVLLAIIAWQNITETEITAKNCRPEVFFCPEEQCAEQLISKINSAEKSIQIAIYSFTHDEIAGALLDAKSRDLEVQVLMESQQAGSEYSDDERLAEAGIEVKFMENPLGIMHNKFMVIDSKLVATGSFNYSKNADERNNENIVFLCDTIIAQRFQGEFERLWNTD